MMQPQRDSSIVQKLEQAIRRDPKRISLLAGLAVIMVVLWGRMFFNGPSTATASLIRRSVAAITDSSEPSVRIPASNPVLDWLGQPRKPLKRNLFAINLDYFARAGTAGVSSDADDPSQATTDQADRERQQQILLDNLQLQAAKLKLQTTMMGEVPRAVVNGELVKEGDSVEGFTVLKIEPRKISVQQDGVVLDVEMP